MNFSKKELTSFLKKFSQPLRTSIEDSILELEGRVQFSDSEIEKSVNISLDMLDQNLEEMSKIMGKEFIDNYKKTLTTAATNAKENNITQEFRIKILNNIKELKEFNFEDDEFIFILDGNYNIDTDIEIPESTIVIVNGDIQAKNIILWGSLYVKNNITCNTLFGRPGEYGEKTHVGGNITATNIIGYVHHIMAEKEIFVKNLINIDSEIIAKQKIQVKEFSWIRAEEEDSGKLHPSILSDDEDPFFDENKFYELLKMDIPFQLKR